MRAGVAHGRKMESGGGNGEQERGHCCENGRGGGTEFEGDLAAESRMMKADFKDSNGGPFGSYERKIDEPSPYSLVAFVREAVDEYIELRLKSLNAILMK